MLDIARREFIASLGGAAAWPLAARAQRPLPVIGFMSSGAESGFTNSTAGFLRGLSDQGYVPGRNVEIAYRWANDRYDRLPDLAADLVHNRVAVIYANGGAPSALAAKSATLTTPIVFTTGGDPVEDGLVPSLNHPGGNVTGVFFLAQGLLPKRLEVLREIAPAALRMGFFVNPRFGGVEKRERVAEDAAHRLGVALIILRVSTPVEIEEAFTHVAEQSIGGLLIDGDPFLSTQSLKIAALADHHAVPAIYFREDVVEAGGLMSYAANIADANRIAGTYVARILKGEKPADLPVQQATKVELIINMKTAKALGLTVPLTLRGRADEVLE